MVTLGSNNDSSDVQKPEGSILSTDRIFQLGNGLGATRSNAVTVLKNGLAFTKTGAVGSFSDIRLKNNIPYERLSKTLFEIFSIFI